MYRITDKAVTAIARSCTRLRYIDLACSFTLLHNCSRTRRLRGWKFPNETGCNNLTDVSVLELAANLPRLKRIGLVRVRFPSPRPLSPRLTRSLVQVTNITDASLDALHARTSLERIHLSYCSNLTVSGVNDLLQHLPRLTHLSLTEVQAFRKKVLQVFCRPPPKVRRKLSLQYSLGRRILTPKLDVGFQRSSTTLILCVFGTRSTRFTKIPPIPLSSRTRSTLPTRSTFGR